MGCSPDRVAVVGSRRRADRDAVEAAVAELPEGSIVVSGGCRGVDAWAEAAARARGLDVVILLPDTSGVRNRGEAAGRYHERNQRVVDACDRVIAFPSSDRTGGTEDTIRRAARAGKPVELR
ncbi:MAG: SLOG family protein [Alphaproteobacteria bacterium]